MGVELGTATRRFYRVPPAGEISVVACRFQVFPCCVDNSHSTVNSLASRSKVQPEQ